jgi:DedD protein
MAERIADKADFAVDELKRRARRRLVGAIVLALAAAVILPLLLEKEPKPLGDDVSVQIPPVDEGRFVNRLTGRESKGASKPDAKSPPKNAPPKAEPPPTPNPAPVTAEPATPVAENPPAMMPTTAPTANGPAVPKKSVTEAEQRIFSPGTKPAAKNDAKTETKSAPEQNADAKAPILAAAAPSPPVTEPAAPAAPSVAKADGFAVQIAAFTDDKGANALAGKLKRAGYASTYTELVDTSRGAMWRVRVGGFGTRPEAEAARAKLKTEGWNGLVVSAAAK